MPNRSISGRSPPIMAVFHLIDMTWTEVDALDRDRIVAILPVGAVEAHGPHLPLGTDPIISRAMAENGARRLSEEGLDVLLLPPFDYTAAPFAAAFAGTVSIRTETATALLVDVGRSLADQGVRWLALANSHLDPDHLRSIYDAIESLGDAGGIEVVFPDITRKPWALRLSEEFRHGSCHAGCFETSVVMNERPELVREDWRPALRANPSSLVTAIREGKRSFAEAGGPQAYFGDPAAANAEEGRATVEELGAILAEATLAVVRASETEGGEP